MEQLAHFVTKSFEYNNSRVLEILNMTAAGSRLGDDFRRRNSTNTDPDPELMSNNSSSGGGGDLEEEIHSHTLTHNPVPVVVTSHGRGSEVDEDEESIDIDITDLSYSSGGQNGVVQSEKVKATSGLEGVEQRSVSDVSSNNNNNNDNTVIGNGRYETSVIRKYDNKRISLDSDAGDGVEEVTRLVPSAPVNKKHVPKNWLIADLVEEKRGGCYLCCSLNRNFCTYLFFFLFLKLCNVGKNILFFQADIRYIDLFSSNLLFFNFETNYFANFLMKTSLLTSSAELLLPEAVFVVKRRRIF